MFYQQLKLGSATSKERLASLNQVILEELCAFDEVYSFFLPFLCCWSAQYGKDWHCLIGVKQF